MKQLVVLIVFVSLLAGTVYAQTPPSSANNPLQGTFQQTTSNTCVPTGLGVLGDTSDITPFSSRYIASRIVYYCNLSATMAGLNVVEGIWGLIRTLNQTGGTAPGSNVTITVYGVSLTSNKTVNLTNGRTVTLVYIGNRITALEINQSTGGSTSSGSGNGNGGCGGCGGKRPVGISYTNPIETHFVIIVDININKPSSVVLGGRAHVAYPVIYWDPATNRYTTGQITEDGNFFDDGFAWGRVGYGVKI